MTYGEIYDNFKRSTAHLSASKQRALFHDNAQRFYRI